MAILDSADFFDSQVEIIVKNKPAYIADDLVTTYWHQLAETYSIPIENLPVNTAIQTIVKNYLMNEVSIQVASNNIDSTNLVEIADGVNVSQWQMKKNNFISNKTYLLDLISASAIYDPLNPPENGTTTSSITNYNEYQVEDESI